jgi:hypothetical protein
MVKYAIALSMSFKELQHFISLNYRSLLPGLLVAAAIVLVVVGLFKPPRV